MANNEAPFEEMSVSQLIKTLELTIKDDNLNKVICFLGMLTTYTEGDQFNIIFNAPSSTGKSFIPTELAKLFPPEDVVEIGYCTPMALAHEGNNYDKEKNQYTVDMSRKIYVLLDQPQTELLARLRPILSHDKKEIDMRMTDRDSKHGMRTKTVKIIGYPTFIFCTANLGMDEQESTRSFVLSPEINQGKIRSAVEATIEKAVDPKSYEERIANDPKRIAIMQRIRAVRDEEINEIRLENPEKITELFFEMAPELHPRHNRDIKRLLSLVKSFALLNLWNRERDENTIIANDDDIENGMQLWKQISPSQELNIPPFLLDFHHSVILDLWEQKKSALKKGQSPKGLERAELLDHHYKVLNRPLKLYDLRTKYLPMLEMADLISQKADEHDARKTLVYPSSKHTEK